MQERIKNKLDDMKLENKNKEELLSDIKDLQQLFNNQGKELIDVRKKLRDTEGDFEIAKNTIKDKNLIIDEQQNTIMKLNSMIDVNAKYEEKLEDIIDKFINGA